jgi:hypothetical protein
MTEPLRPMSTGQLLDHTFALYRKNFLLFVGIAMAGPAANVIFQLITVGASVGTPFMPRQRVAPGTGAAFATLGLSFLFGYILLLAGMAISHAATVKAVAAVYLGREISIVGAYKALRGRIGSLFGTVFLITLAMAGAIGVAVILAIPIVLLIRTAGTGPFMGLVTGLVVFVVMLLVFAAMVWIFLRYGLAVQACVVEDMGPRASLKRSVFLTQGSRWRVFVIYAIFFLLSVILGGGLGALAVGAGAALHNKIAAAVLVYLAGFVAGSLTGPLATIGLSLLYYDERVRKEAFDLQLMMASLDAPALATAPPSATTAQI